MPAVGEGGGKRKKNPTRFPKKTSGGSMGKTPKTRNPKTGRKAPSFKALQSKLPSKKPRSYAASKLRKKN